MSNETADILEQAADLIENVGHCKGKLWEFRSPNYATPVAYCIRGAINTVGRNIDSVHAALQFLDKDAGGSIVVWNDARERTAAEVIDMLRRCAKNVRNEHVGPQ